MLRIHAIKLLIVSFLCLVSAYAQASAKDTFHILRVISAGDGSPLDQVHVEAMVAGIRIASWQTDADGYITIRKTETGNLPSAILRLNYPGFEKITLSPEQLPLNDTLVLLVQPKPVQLEEISITAYILPVLEKPQKFRIKCRASRSPQKSPVYSPSQCIAYEALQQGLWLQKDTLARNCLLALDTVNKDIRKGSYGNGLAGAIQRYFITNLSYPDQARDFAMEERICLGFELDEKGRVNYIKVMKGDHIDLVLEAANALARMPRLNLRDFVLEYQNEYPPRIPKQVRFILPVKFILK